MKILQIVEVAHRATLEEQDDTIIWLMHLLRSAGADISVVLCGSAVAYAAMGQDASGLRFGDWRQTHPPHIDLDIEKLAARAVDVYAIQEDLDDRGLHPRMMIPSVKAISRAGMVRLFKEFDQVWHW